MQRHTLHEYYWFGTCLRYLQEATEFRPIHGESHVLFNLDQFFTYLDDLDLVVTRRAAFRLESLRNELLKSVEGAGLSSDQANALVLEVGRLRDTLEAELTGFNAYVVTPKVLDSVKLLSDVPALFAPGVYEELPGIAQIDFSEAAQCIAFERPTAAAFHILRGTESVLRHFYQSLIKQQRVKPLMWGPVVSDMRKRNKTKHHTVLLNHLDNIRVSFRNPTQHPEKVYDIYEVQDLWSICVEAVNRMIRVLATGTNAPEVR